jgi:hypothetical protein
MTQGIARRELIPYLGANAPINRTIFDTARIGHNSRLKDHDLHAFVEPQRQDEPGRGGKQEYNVAPTILADARYTGEMACITVNTREN